MSAIDPDQPQNSLCKRFIALLGQLRLASLEPGWGWWRGRLSSSMWAISLDLHFSATGHLPCAWRESLASLMRLSFLPLRDSMMDVSHKPMAANGGAGITCAFQSTPAPFLRPVCVWFSTRLLSSLPFFSLLQRWMVAAMVSRLFGKPEVNCECR